MVVGNDDIKPYVFRIFDFFYGCGSRVDRDDKPRSALFDFIESPERKPIALFAVGDIVRDGSPSAFQVFIKQRS